MKKEFFASDKVYQPKGTFSQVVKYGDIAFIAGQMSTDKDGNKLYGTMAEQTKNVLTNISTILSDMGLDLDAILLMRVYLSDMSKAGEMNEVYNEFFKGVEIMPARATVGVDLGDLDVEMYAIVGLSK